MPPEFDDAPSEAASTPEVEYAIEGDPSFDDGTGEGVDESTTEAPTLTPSVDPSIDVANRLAQLERMQGAYELLMQRFMTPGSPQGNQPQTPADWEKIQTVEELRSRIQADLQSHVENLEQAGARAASEARARGLFTDQAIGQGLGYDSLMARHIAPLVKARPQLGQLLAMQDDPATASYFLGIFHEINHKMGGDPVKTAKTLLSALNATKQGGQQVLKSIQQGTKRAVQQITRAGGGAGSPGKKTLSADAIAGMSDEEFDRLERQIAGK